MNTYKVVSSGSQSRWVGPKNTGRRVRLYRGQTVELTEAEAKELGPKRVTLATELGSARTTYTAGKVDPIAEDQPGAMPSTAPAVVPKNVDAGDVGDDEGDDGEGDDILDSNLADVKAFIEMEDDPEALKQLVANERKGKNRKGVLDAAAERFSQLKKA